MYKFLEGYVVAEQILTPTQTTPIPLQIFFFMFLIFFVGVGDEFIKLEKILPPHGHLHILGHLLHFFLKGGGVNLKNRLTDQIPTPTLRNSIPLYFRGVGTVLCYSSFPPCGAPCFLLSVLFIYSVDPAFTP